MVLAAYFQPFEDPDIITAQLAWWADELQDWTREQVVWGLREWNRRKPDKRPTPGHILDILKRQRGKKEAARMPAYEPQAEPGNRPSAEEANDILRRAGFLPKTIPGAPE